VEANTNALWKSDSAVAPSPIQAEAIAESPRSADAIAHPTACTNCVARLPEIVKNPYSFDEYITGNWRPFTGS
jgi:hypothetical protein